MISCAFKNDFEAVGLNDFSSSYTFIAFKTSFTSFSGPMIRLFSRRAVICSSVSVFPSILNEECIVLMRFSFLSLGDGLSRNFALICPIFSEIETMSFKISGVIK